MKYKVICNNCSAEREISIISIPGYGEKIDWLENEDNAFHPINSGRKRLDGKYGFSCSCGNSDLLTDQERNNISNLQSPDPKQIAEIVKDLKIDKTTFEMIKLG